jgi:hypothetical protein
MGIQVIKVFPSSRLGRISTILLVLTPILFFIGSSFRYLFYDSVPAGKTIMEDIGRRPVLALTMLTGMLAGISAFIIGLLAMIKKKDYSLLVFLSTIIGALLTIFLIVEIAST